jgi:hypothetical protein
MSLKQKSGELSRRNKQVNLKLTIIYLLLIILFATLIIFFK